LEALYPGIEGRVSVVPHGAWAPNLVLSASVARDRLAISSTAPVLLFFGAIRRNKGLMTLLDALGKIREGGGRLPLLVVAGAMPDGESFSDYGRRIRELGLEGSVLTRVAFISGEELPYYFAAADIVALPYDRAFAAQSGVLMEAYGYGRPVLVTDVGALGETVREDGTGEVVAPNDPEALAVALGRLMNDESSRKHAADRMLLLREQKYSWARVARLTEAVYEQAVLR
jgi:glycosyltransferase involved in cell wall biosynthesis